MMAGSDDKIACVDATAAKMPGKSIGLSPTTAVPEKEEEQQQENPGPPGGGGGPLTRARDVHASPSARTALSCPSERDLRVPCYCEENVWRLAYRRLYGPDRGGDKKKSVGAAADRRPKQRLGTDEGTIGARVAGMHHQQHDQHHPESYVVFMSNEERCCPMFSQVAKEDPNDPCLWDYHVVLLCAAADAGRVGREKRAAVGGGVSFIRDMDSRLPYPCPVETYLAGTFRNMEYLEEEFREKYAPLFRVIKAESFLQHFYSDRMHMFDETTGEWHATPPEYDCIMAGWDGDSRSGFPERRSNLDDYIGMSQGGRHGRGGSLISEDEKKESLGEVLTLEEFRGRFAQEIEWVS